MSRPSALYRVEHVTRFQYSEPVRESVVTLYLQPRNDASQHLESFRILTDPGAELGNYEDCFGNAVHFFDVPAEHDQLTVTSKSLVALHASEPEEAAGSGWDALKEVQTHSMWHLLHPDRADPTDGGARRLRRPARHRAPRDPPHFASGTDGPDSRSARVRARTNPRGLADRRRPAGRERRLPGLFPHHAGDRARLGYPRPSTPPGTSSPSGRDGNRPWRKPATRGSNACCPASAGSGRTPRTTQCPRSITSGWPPDGTTATFRRPAVPFGEPPGSSSRWRSTSRPWIPSPPAPRPGPGNMHAAARSR